MIETRGSPAASLQSHRVADEDQESLIIVEEVGRRNVQIEVDHVAHISSAFKNWILNLSRVHTKHLETRRAYASRKKQKTTRELICRHDGRRISNVGLKQTKCCDSAK